RNRGTVVDNNQLDRGIDFLIQRRLDGVSKQTAFALKKRYDHGDFFLVHDALPKFTNAAAQELPGFADAWGSPRRCEYTVVDIRSPPTTVPRPVLETSPAALAGVRFLSLNRKSRKRRTMQFVDGNRRKSF